MCSVPLILSDTQCVCVRAAHTHKHKQPAFCWCGGGEEVGGGGEVHARLPGLLFEHLLHKLTISMEYLLQI